MENVKEDSAYIIWKGMKQRCNDPNNISYHNYGGKGIKVCKEWEKNFFNFIGDIGPRPSAKHSLDRIDNQIGYCKTNCRWVERKLQNRNQGMRRDNTSGVCGVVRQVCKRGNKSYTNWQAVWRDLQGKPKSKSFSVNKYGDEEAFRLARQFREDKIKELNEHGAGYAKRHGKKG